MAESGGVEMRQNKQMLSAIKCDNKRYQLNWKN